MSEMTDAEPRTLSRSFRHVRLRLLLLLLTPFLQSCDIDVDVPAPTLWEGDLAPAQEGTMLTGSVAAVSRSGRTETGISIADAEPGITYEWRLREGSCAEPGPALGGAAIYPVLTTSAGGNASAETILAEALAPAGSYHAVLLPAEQADPPPVACGNLVRVDT